MSVTITYRLWHISDNIFKNLDAVSLLHCEKVCDLWKQYLIKERVWQKAVEKFANRYPAYVQQMGWWRYLPTFGGEQTLDLLVYRHTYWKMTNLTLEELSSLSKLVELYIQNNQLSTIASDTFSLLFCLATLIVIIDKI